MEEMLNTKSSVIFYSGAKGGCDFYRSRQPFSILRKYHPEWIADKLNRVHLSSDTQRYNIVHTYRNHQPMMITAFEKFNSLGKITIFDLDDDVFHMPSWNQAYMEYRPGIVKVRLTPEMQAHFKRPYVEYNVLDNIHKLINISTIATASTPYLANELAKHRNNNDVYVVPNFIDTEWLPMISPRLPRNVIKIGWSGGYNHDEDLKVAIPAVEQILWQYPNTTFTFIGADYRNLMRNPPKDRVFHVLGKPNVHEYYQLQADEQLDIGIIPVTDDLINFSKSPIKWMEYAIADIPTIASPIGPYPDNIQHQHTGWLVKKNKHIEWVKAIEFYIQHPEDARAYAANAKKDILNRYTMDHVANIFIPILEKHIYETMSITP